MQIRVMSVAATPEQQQLPLGALAGVEEEAFAVPPQQIAVVVAGTGRRLGGGPQHDQFAGGHRPEATGLARPAAQRFPAAVGAPCSRSASAGHIATACAATGSSRVGTGVSRNAGKPLPSRWIRSGAISAQSP